MAPLSSIDLAYLLRSERRQQALDVLADGPLTTRELAEGILADVHGDTRDRDAYKSIYVGLYQDHLPTLAEAGVVDFDRDRNGVAPGPRFETARDALAALREVADDV